MNNKYHCARKQLCKYYKYYVDRKKNTLVIFFCKLLIFIEFKYYKYLLSQFVLDIIILIELFSQYCF